MVPRATVGRSYTENFISKGVFDQLLRLTEEEAHANVVKYFDFLASASCIFVVMEELQGDELFNALHECAPLSEGFMRRCSRDALAALEKIHSTGLVHRDVKPENLRFRDRERTCLVLIDFGLCCPATTRTRSWCTTSNEDEVKAVAGTLPFMAPEVFSSRYSTPVDIWAFGVTLYIMLTGKLPPTSDPSKIPDSLAIGEWADMATALPSAVDLLRKVLVVDPTLRLSAREALSHQWFAETGDGPHKVGASEYADLPKSQYNGKA